ncbi:MAG: TonB-dependent receptor [Melioribacteraceae bacterium]|nr:MAG: TonB-dependent receptor [Melioribacteraceae bacterium]
MQIKYSTILALIFLSVSISVFARETLTGNIMMGKVIDANTGSNLEFANIIVQDTNFEQVKGTVTGTDGTFIIGGLDDGTYHLKISYIGYEPDSLMNIKLAGNKRMRLGEFKLSQITYSTDDVVVSSERAPISYEIDKKVINVSEQFTASSGSAVDVLENVPSVNVDIEGNVSLRGSSSFTVLIDGRPTIMDAADALEQIPAATIENIEIITNPSAKYNPEGTAGIINIVMKKQERSGMSAIVELNGGLNEKYGVESLFDYKTQEYDWKVNVGYSNRFFDMDDVSERRTTTGGITSYINSDGGSERGRKRFNIETEFTLFPASNNIVTFGGQYRTGESLRNSALNYNEWTSDDPVINFFRSSNDRFRSRNSAEIFGNYLHKFGANGHQIMTEFEIEYDEGDEETTNELYLGSDISEGKISTEKGPGRELQFKSDYTLPLGEDSKFEAGYQMEMEFSDDNTGSYDYNTTTNQYDYQAQFSRQTRYDKREHAVYSMYAGKLGAFGYQTGLRGEYTGRKIEVVEQNQIFEIDRFDLFPSVHMSYEIVKDHQLMGSYTRRINRPRGWNLEPFETWVDAYNVRKGNPALEPEFVNSYEFGYQTFIGKSILSAETYFRESNNKIERIRTTYSPGVSLMTFENVGKDYSLGTELMINFDPLQKWNVNLMGNIYNYKVEGALNGQDFSRESTNWDLRFNNSIRFSKSTMLQFNLMYNSPSVSSQGEREGFFHTNVAIRHDLFDRMITAVLQIRDVLGTAEYKFTTVSDGYYDFRHVTRESPIVMLNIKFNFNNYKDRNRGRDGGGDMMGGEDDF